MFFFLGEIIIFKALVVLDEFIQEYVVHSLILHIVGGVDDVLLVLDVEPGELGPVGGVVVGQGPVVDVPLLLGALVPAVDGQHSQQVEGLFDERGLDLLVQR